MDLYTWLILGHLMGTVLGVGGATMIEVHLNRSLAGGMKPEYRELLGLNFTVLRIGLVLGVFTGFGFIAYYISTGQHFRLENPVLWAKLFFVLVVAINALMLQAHKIGLYWGSAFSFVTWWGLLVAGFMLSNSIQASFIELAGAYIGAIVAGAFILHKLRELVAKKNSA